LAEENNLCSIALPAISTGIFGFPLEKCAHIMIEEIKQFLQDCHNVKDVYIVLWDRHAYSIFEKNIAFLK
jgi:O-acetyl-ADP-ribose deacetylase (regulator of RNase III)